LFLFFCQDIAHAGGGYPAGFNVPNSSLSLAGFEVIIYGRFWVIAEGEAFWMARGRSLAVAFVVAVFALPVLALYLLALYLSVTLKPWNVYEVPLFIGIMGTARFAFHMRREQRNQITKS
jgi:hypothetical protein